MMKDCSEKNQCLTARPCHRKASGILSLRFQHISGTAFILICNKKLIPLSALDLPESDSGTSFLALLTGITGKAKAAASSYRFPWQSTEVYSSSHFLKSVFLLMGEICAVNLAWHTYLRRWKCKTSQEQWSVVTFLERCRSLAPGAPLLERFLPLFPPQPKWMLNVGKVWRQALIFCKQ